jgi:hypothetical protein
MDAPRLIPDGPERLAEIISRLVTQRGWGGIQQRQKLEDAWRKAAGPQFSARSKLGIFKRGLLEVIVGDAVLHHELQFVKSRLLAELAKSLGPDKVTELRFRLGVMG